MIFLLNVENYLNIITLYIDFEIYKFIKGQYILYVSPYGHILVTESRRGPVYSLNCSYLKHYISKSVNYHLNPPILCVIWYHDQCNSQGNVSYGNTTSAFHLAMCHTVLQPVYSSWQCVMRYHNKCISAGNVLCGTTTNAFHLAMCYAVPRPMSFTWQCVIRYHDQCISHAMCHTVPRPVSFTWKCIIRYHD